ncbi:hypothetical protein P879_07973 [Paragonimus westermani]|uniref:Groucho/TLE N-terminal Q-rich domain-containing protein n=1 Tax=Paragonimus westermani TaxID=34504 RepID=A0A8T0D982_9TREM|nr:hypothetical protein P879_07973 [Paragonimus westermani]
MFSSRPSAPPGPGTSYKFTVVETCDRIKEEFNYIQQQNHSLHLEREKLISERSDMQRICVMYYEMANGLNLEMHRQMEIAKRLSAILTQVLPFLSQEHQSQVLSAIERAKQVTMQELNSVLTAQIEDAKTSKFFNGNNSGLMAEQLEAYKMSALSGTPPSSLASGLHGLNMSHGVAGSSYGVPTNIPNSLPGVIPSLSPPNNPAMSAALLNGLISAAGAPSIVPGGFMVPTTGSSTLSRDSDKLTTSDEKQRAAAVAAANSILLGGRPPGIGSSLLPPPPNPLSGILGANVGDFPSFPGTFPLAPGTGEPSDATGVVSMGQGVAPNSSQQPSRSASTGSGSGSVGRQSNTASGLQSAAQSAVGALHLGISRGLPGSTGSLASDEKRRKFTDSRDAVGQENGSWFSNEEYRCHPEKASSSRRSTGAQQPNSSPQLGSDSNASYPTTSSAPAVGSIGGSSGRSSQISEFSSAHRWRSSNKSTSGPGAHSFVVLPGGQTRSCALASAPGATTAPGLPRRLQHLASLPHGDVVCAVTIGPCPAGRASSLATASDACRGMSNTASDVESLAESPGSNIASSVAAHFAYTGARGSVKLWDLAAIGASMVSGISARDIAPLFTFDCLCQDSYVRSIKLFSDSSHLVIGGESNALTLWDLNGPGRRKAELTFEAPACYALALSPNGKLCYSCCSDGYVSVWDVHNQSVVHQFHGHVDGTSCVELTSDGNRLWTGGLDSKVCCWDMRGTPARPLHHIEFKSQVFSLGLTVGHSPLFVTRHQVASMSPRSGDGDSASSAGLLRDTSSPQSVEGRTVIVGGSNKTSTNTGGWLAVGLESSEIEVVAIGPDGPAPAGMCASLRDESSPTVSPLSSYTSSSTMSQPQHFRLTHHESCVLALRFAHHGDWFITTGKDHQVNAWRTPYGACLLETKEAASVLTCDISPDDKFVVTGSGDKRANLYEVIFSGSSA